MSKASTLGTTASYNGYRVIQMIGRGSYGTVYEAMEVASGRLVALKADSGSDAFSHTRTELKVYQVLNGCPLFPAGSSEDGQILVTDLLGCHLEKLLRKCGHVFSLKTVLMIADQILCRFQYLHSKNFIHRDVKPENLLCGRPPNQGSLYLIDFGLANLYRDPISGDHISMHSNMDHIGNVRYASINNHLHRELSRRDDLESFAYVLVFLMKGKLPWCGTKAKDRQKKIEMVGALKMTTSVDSICAGLPQEFAQFLREVKQLRFDEEPPYAHYREIFRDLFIREGYIYDSVFDWSKLPMTEHLPNVTPVFKSFKKPTVIHPKIGDSRMAKISRSSRF